MHYLDTSVIVSLLQPEPSTATVQRWVARHAGSRLAVSDWSAVEIASALLLLQRTGALDAKGRTVAQETFDLLVGGTFEVLDVRRSVYAQAATWCARHELTLRAGDALHLAAAADAGLELVTRDAEQARAARALGLTVREIARA